MHVIHKLVHFHVDGNTREASIESCWISDKIYANTSPSFWLEQIFENYYVKKETFERKRNIKEIFHHVAWSGIGHRLLCFKTGDPRSNLQGLFNNQPLSLPENVVNENSSDTSIHPSGAIPNDRVFDAIPLEADPPRLSLRVIVVWTRIEIVTPPDFSPLLPFLCWLMCSVRIPAGSLTQWVAGILKMIYISRNLMEACGVFHWSHDSRLHEVQHLTTS